ncbi:hypothetical protein NHX12_024943, partial [Muraenolepis orangiensis]
TQLEEKHHFQCGKVENHYSPPDTLLQVTHYSPPDPLLEENHYSPPDTLLQVTHYSPPDTLLQVTHYSPPDPLLQRRVLAESGDLLFVPGGRTQSLLKVTGVGVTVEGKGVFGM